MKRFATTTALAALGASLFAPAGKAAPNDLVLGFTLQGSQDYIVDLGNAYSIGVGVGGATVQDLTTGFGFNQASLVSNFGSVNGVSMGVLGGKSTGIAGQDLFVTQVRAGGVGDPLLPGSSLQGVLTSSGSSGSPFPNGVINGTGLSAGQGTLWGQGDPSSFSSLIYNGTVSSPSFVGTMGGLSPAGTIAGSVLYEDLYQEIDSPVKSGRTTILEGNWVYQGYFTLDLTGETSQVLTFTSVPEPSTFSLLLTGAGLLFISMRRRFNHPLA